MSITIYDLAIYRLGLPVDTDELSGGQINEAGLPFFGGCCRCGASIAAHNSSPSKAGYLMCSADCIGDSGWDTVEAADEAIFEEDAICTTD